MTNSLEGKFFKVTSLIDHILISGKTFLLK